MPASQTPSAIFTRIQNRSIPGGPTVLGHGKRMPDGVLTILSLPDVWMQSCSLPESIRKCTALTIVRWNLLQTPDAVIICFLTSFLIRKIEIAGYQCHLNLMTLPSRADFLKFQGTDYYMLTYKYFSGLLRF